mgnify:CR=1 FL=1
MLFVHVYLVHSVSFVEDDDHSSGVDESDFSFPRERYIGGRDVL